MKIAVSAQGRELTSEVDPRFGRARWFVIVDTESGQTELIDNSEAADAASGAGVASGQRVIDAGAQAVITGRVGPNAENVLTSAGIRIAEKEGGTVEEAVDWFKRERT